MALLEDKAVKVEKLGRTVAGSHYREGRPAEQIALLAEELGAGAVVAGFRGRGPSGLPFSGDPWEDTLRRVGCALVVVRGPRESDLAIEAGSPVLLVKRARVRWMPPGSVPTPPSSSP